ncbi:hypothetical protein GCM10007160_39810 [Litchfieldella qijiaojingensis]|uniref:Uncharacterized protein n=1 Tax=Litchfieldella qijiaojingensis TaxID=980347 RepID=A0ABQ2ZCV4_9GAMM|nr:hypothetical protein GCM10007160_39810 [Halomonas qijiaojingensis]
MIQAAEGIVADVPEIDEQTVSQTIDAMVEADPDLAWLKDMEERGDFKASALAAGANKALRLTMVNHDQAPLELRQAQAYPKALKKYLSAWGVVSTMCALSGGET